MKEQFLKRLAQPPAKGGWNAIDIDYHPLSRSSFSTLSFDLQFVSPAPDIELAAYNNYTDEVYQTMEEIKKNIMKVKLRTSSPFWDVPVEIWRSVIFPDKTRYPMRTGLGADPFPTPPSYVYDMISIFFAYLFALNTIPFHFYMSQGNNVMKKY